MRHTPLLLALFAAILAPDARAADDLREAIATMKPTLDLRLRHERVDHGAFAREAAATTARLRAGFVTGDWHGISLFGEGEVVRALGSERFDSTANGRSDFPIVADPDAEEVNQFGLRFRYGGLDLAAGRQRLVYDNARHIGDVAFRQNQQTFDAVAGSYQADEWTFRLAWLDEVHRVFGDDHPNPLQAEQALDATLINVSRKLGGAQLVGYHYDVENEDLPAASARTTGVRYAGTHAFDEARKLVWALDLARQDDAARAPARDAQEYRFAEVGYGVRGHVARVGYERLGGDGSTAFQTPLATLHAFNGWADQFLVTPPNGLIDRYAGVDGPLLGGTYVVTWHDFNADRGGASYGRELDLAYRRPWGKRVEWELKAADYRSDGFSRDVRKMWLSLTYRY